MSEIQVSAGLVPPERSLLGVQMVFSLCPHTGHPVCVSVSRSPLIRTPTRLD